MQYIWAGTTFTNFVSSQILTNQAASAYYYYDQNYIGFFPITYTNNTVQNLTTIPTTPTYPVSGTLFNDVPGSSTQASLISTNILTAQLNAFASQSNNVIAAYTQNPSDFVNNSLISTLSTSAASAGIANVLSAYAPTLTSPESNFAFQNILSNWPGGSSIIQNLAAALCNYQSTIAGAIPQSLIDFKTKILRQQTAYASSVGNVQNNVSTFTTQGTFTNLASAFPVQLGQLPGVLTNHLTSLNTEIAQCLPTADLPPQLSGIVQSIFGGLFGGGLPKILTPIDKIVNDIGGLQAGGQNNFLSIYNNDSDLLAGEANFVNQAVGLLSNIVAKIPIVSQLANVNPITNPNQIASILIGNNNSSVYNFTNAIPTTPAQQAINVLVGLVATTNSPPITGTKSISYTTMIPSISSILLDTDPSISVPNITTSPDPSVALQQSTSTALQNSANFSTLFQNLLQGQGYNNLNEIPMRPRNTTITGILGSYNIDIGYFF
jgi:hypothetical protein